MATMDTGQQRMYPRPPGGFLVPAGVPMPQDMAHPMQGMGIGPMMMQPQYASYPGMMLPATPVIPMPIAPLNMTSQLTQMLADSARHGRASNVFFKTRLCNKWRLGNCPFGDKCTYAHGQHELRYIPPELLAQLEREQRLQEQRQSLPQGLEPSSHQAGPGQRDIPAPKEDAAYGDEQLNKSQLYFKTRLCIRFMQNGYCSRGTACTFAHGYDDLRLLGHMQQQQPPQQPLSVPTGGGPGPGIARKHSTMPIRLPPSIEMARAASAALGVGQAATIAQGDTVRDAVEAIQSGEALKGGPYADSAQEGRPTGG